MSGASINILFPQVPFVRGGTEALAEALKLRIIERGHRADIVTIPFRWEPKEQIIREMLLWRMPELQADMVIPLKFPAYCVRHPRSVVWLQHQYRQVYEFHGTPLSDFANTPPDGDLREKIVAFDTRCLSEARAIYTNSRNTLARLQRYSGLDGTALHIPPLHPERLRCDGYGDFVLAVGRLEQVKRFDLLLRAFAMADQHLRLKIAGVGGQERQLRELARELRIAGRVEFLGAVSDVDLADLYAGCRFVHFAPFDEDYGLVTIEAMRSGKAVITAEDSGGPLELVQDGVNGLVVPPEPEYHADALNRLWLDADLCRSLGESAAQRAREITWDHVLDELLQWLN